MAEENKEVLVVEEEQPRQWTFLNYLSGIKKYKWWVVGFSVAGALIGFLGFKFILNPSKKTLTASYTYELAGKYVDTDTIRLVDGSTFNPYDLTSAEYLQNIKDAGIKANKAGYNKIDVEKISKNNSITIIKNVTYYNDNDASSMTVSYKIEAKASIFPTDNVGKEFLFDVVNYSKVISSKAIKNYETRSSFTSNFAELTFDKQINQLADQYNTILSVYNSLASEFTDTVIANDQNEKIYELRNKFNASYITNSVQSFTSELSNRMDANQYVNYTKGQEDDKIAEIKSLCETYIESLDNDQRLLAIYEEQRKALTDSSAIIGSDTNVSSQIASLNSSITNLKLEINSLEKELTKNGYEKDGSGKYVFNPLNENSTIYKLTAAKAGETVWSKGCEAFKNEINEKKTQLDADRLAVSDTYKYCYTLYKNRVNISNGGYVTLSGGMSSIIGAAAGLAGGFVITTLVTAAIFIYKKEQK